MKKEVILFTVAYWLSYVIGRVLQYIQDIYLQWIELAERPKFIKALWDLELFKMFIMDMDFVLLYLFFYFPSLGFFGWFRSDIDFTIRAFLANGLAWLPFTLVLGESIIHGKFAEFIALYSQLTGVFLFSVLIVGWLIQKLSQFKRLAFVNYCMYTLGENFRKSEKIKIILRSIRTLLACLHSLFRKVLFK
jgi:hypothetical protein